MSDNGLLWGEHAAVAKKRCPYEECIRVPMAVRYPPAGEGREDTHLVLNIDLAPTFAEIAGITAPSKVEGMSLVRLLTDEAHGGAWRSDFLTEQWNSDGVDTMPSYASVRSEEWKYIVSDDRGTQFEELYDLKRDPYEMTSVVKEPANGATLEALRRRLEQLRRE